MRPATPGAKGHGSPSKRGARSRDAGEVRSTLRTIDPDEARLGPRRRSSPAAPFWGSRANPNLPGLGTTSEVEKLPKVENNHSDKCSLCGADYRKCKHPWELPFDQWPSHLVTELPSAPSAEGAK